MEVYKIEDCKIEENGAFGWKCIFDGTFFGAYKKESVVNQVKQRIQELNDQYTLPKIKQRLENDFVNKFENKIKWPLPPHLQILVDKIEAAKEAKGYKMQEITCEEIFGFKD